METKTKTKIKTKTVGFSLRKVSTEQFAIIEEGFEEKANIRLGTNIRSGADEKQKMVSVFTFFTFESNSKPFLIIEAGCHFVLKDDAWGQMLNKDENCLNVPKGILQHLAMLTIGTARGILHAKTEGTCFNKFIIPAINVTEMITEDSIIKFNAQ
jgi:hypothetical protein